MNKERRDKLSKLLGQLSDIRGEIESIKDDEQSAFDSLPESFQNGEKGELSQAAIDAMDSAVSDLETVEQYIEDAQQ